MYIIQLRDYSGVPGQQQKKNHKKQKIMFRFATNQEMLNPIH